MLSFKNLKIGTKLMLTTALLIALAIATISTIIGFSVQKMAETDAQQIAKETAYHYANVVKTILEVPLDEARAVATTLEVSINSKGFKLTRQQANLILKYFLDHRPHFFAAAAVFEPNAFDGKDANFINAPGHDETGRFIPYWSRNNKGKSVLAPVVGYQTEDFYLLPKRTKTEIVMEPFIYPVQDKDVLMTSLIVPILDTNHNFMGVQGFDLTLEQLQRQIGEMEIAGFKDAYLTVYSAKGTIVASGESSELGKTLKKTTDSHMLIDKVLKHEPFYLNRKSTKLGKTVMTYGAPVEIGNNGAHWLVAVNLPEDELQAESKRMVELIGIIGIATLLLLIVTLYLLIRNWVGPLLQINHLMKSLAQGELVENKIKYTAQDEIAEIIHSSKKLQGALKSTIKQAQAIATGNYSREVKRLSPHDQLGHALSDMTHTLRGVITQINAIAVGDYTTEVKPLSEHDQLGHALSKMTCKLRNMTTKTAEQNWIKTGQTQLNDQLSGEQNIMQLAENTINFLTPYVDAQVGAFYLAQGKHPNIRLKMMASYAYTWRKNLANEFQLGEGLVGQAALERKPIIITQAPEDYIYIQSGLGKSRPRTILVRPFLYENQLKGVIELASFNLFTKRQIEFIDQVMTSLGITVNTAESRSRMQALLRQSESQADELQEQTEKLQAQQQALQQTNEELQAQSEELQTQQEELRQTNEELEERTRELEGQTEEIQQKNLTLEKNKAEMEKTQLALETKAKELELASQYKSEFLANMSHELRTPLNSLLILAQLLAQNKPGNLDDKQVEYARTIHSAGTDLLSLINDILDLSKVEAGKMQTHPENLPLAILVETLEPKFRHTAQEKGLAFHITVADDVPAVLRTDAQRLQQIINNLLSNAFKFTQQGEVRLDIKSQKSPLPFQRRELAISQNFIAFSVTDTGIGIPLEKQKLIFHAFQQADGSTSRCYGGTGLGLSISRQLARLLGGELTLESQEGQGSTFTLYLPETQNSVVQEFKSSGPQAFSIKEVQALSPSGESEEENRTQVFSNLVSRNDIAPSGAAQKIATTTQTALTKTSTELVDDRDNLQPTDKSILVIEDDRQFSSILMEMVREKNFKCLAAEDGKTGLQLAEEYQPNAIILDVGLPQLDGWTVMERLKDNPQTRHIPVHFMSGSDQDMDAKRMGAIGYLHKPVSVEKLSEALKKIEQFIAKTLKNLLIVVENPLRQQQILEIVSGSAVQSRLAKTKDEALQQLRQAQIDCLILDIDIQHGLKLLEQLQQEESLSQIPVIIYAERELTASEEHILRHCAEKLTVKAVRSQERLLDETTLFLHLVEANLPQEKRQILHKVHDKEAILAYKKVLIVDDDMRNTFALMTVLEDKNMEVVVAENGKEALELLDENPDILMILMDIMMPEMDGYETMQHIRKQERFRHLPIIALTAKAMKGDKAKCIEAGANDYLSKPVDTDKLLSLMRVWLYR
jgi:signal transduction histidine kinase/CheY-like chemotaxis protein